MNPLEEMRSRVEALRTEILGLSEIPELDETQEARWGAANTEYDEARAAYEAESARQARIIELRDSVLPEAVAVPGSPTAPAFVKRNDPFENLGEIRYANPNSADMVARAVTALSDTKVRGVSDDAIQEAVRKVETVPGAAVHALVHGSPAYRSAFGAYMQAKGENVIWTPEEAEAVRTAMATSTGSTGGFTLPTLLDPTLIHTGDAVNNPLRRLARVETGTQNVWHGVGVGNVTTYWKGEGSAMTEGSPTFAQPTVTAAMLTAYLAASYEIFEDSNHQAQLPGLIAESMSYKESTAFVSGSGSTAPKGIVTAISGTTASTVTATTRATIGAVDVFALVEAVPARYEAAATWVANKKLFNTIRQMSTSSTGALFWTDLGSGTPLNLLGSPIAMSSDMTTATTSGSIVAILGDFKQFLIYDRIGIQVEFMANVVDGSGLPTGQRGLVAHKRVGSDVTDVNAFRFLKA